jgi:hypothetical protein
MEGVFVLPGTRQLPSLCKITHILDMLNKKNKKKGVVSPHSWLKKAHIVKDFFVPN